MTLRSDKTSGIITCVFGIVMIGFATIGLLIVVLQRVVISTMLIPQDADGRSFTDAVYAIHGVWFIFLPLMILGGVIYAVAGLYVRRGSLAARRVAQFNAMCGYVWIAAYSISCYRIMDIIGLRPEVLPEPAYKVFQWYSIIVGTLIGAAFPTGLLYIFSRPQTPCIEGAPQ